MIFVGIDPGLTAPAVCVMDQTGAVVRTVRTGKLRGQERVDLIVKQIISMLVATELESVTFGSRPVGTLVSIEAYAYSKRTQGQNTAVEAVGVLKYQLWRHGIPFVQMIGPMQLKKYITGDGKADKQAMMDAAAAAGVQVIDDNQADAWGLATILRDAYLLETEGVRPSTLYRYHVCEELRPWIREHVEHQRGA